ncbi:MAG: hypothetical protein HXM02_07945 [[Eubacterium] sulci]|nr:hypothetical protein [[Eubacterium] sulci]
MAKRNEELEAVETMTDEEATEAVENTAGEEAAENTTPVSDDYLEELVEIMLFKDSDKYSDDLVVTLNGKNYQIKRGVKVMVPRKVQLVIEDSMKQAGLAADYEEEAQQQYKELENRL